MRQEGYEVRVVHDGGECLRVAVNFRPHALIADVLMKVLGGFEVASIFAARFPKCHVLLLSANRDAVSDPGPFKAAAKFEVNDVLHEFLAGCEAEA